MTSENCELCVKEPETDMSLSEILTIGMAATLAAVNRQNRLPSRQVSNTVNDINYTQAREFNQFVQAIRHVTSVPLEVPYCGLKRISRARFGVQTWANQIEY